MAHRTKARELGVREVHAIHGHGKLQNAKFSPK
jgi:hypothetical protein